MSAFEAKAKRHHGYTRPDSQTLIAIGGRLDLSDAAVIPHHLKEIIGKEPVLVITAASSVPVERMRTHKALFDKLGMKSGWLDIRERRQAFERARIHLAQQFTVAFITGGNQKVLWEKLKDTPILDELMQYAVIIGTSAGTAIVGDPMPYRESLMPGFGIAQDIVFDQHYNVDPRRPLRLQRAINLRPRHLGIGVPENTAVVLKREHSHRFQQGHVIGDGLVHVFNAQHLKDHLLSNNSLNLPGDLLASGQLFNLDTYRLQQKRVQATRL